jgi:hypothetical protein
MTGYHLDWKKGTLPIKGITAVLKAPEPNERNTRATIMPGKAAPASNAPDQDVAANIVPPMASILYPLI